MSTELDVLVKTVTDKRSKFMVRMCSEQAKAVKRGMSDEEVIKEYDHIVIEWEGECSLVFGVQSHALFCCPHPPAQISSRSQGREGGRGGRQGGREEREGGVSGKGGKGGREEWRQITGVSHVQESSQIHKHTG